MKNKTQERDKKDRTNFTEVCELGPNVCTFFYFFRQSLERGQSISRYGPLMYAMRVGAQVTVCSAGVHTIWTIRLYDKHPRQRRTGDED